jgi:formate dehydrogenase iron-sulfur subunit
MRKCDLCADRIADGGKPECVGACPNDALQFGDREQLLRAAHQRIADNPNRYIARVWGEREWGGTSVMYLSDVDLAALNWPAETAPPIPALTDPMIEKTPFIGGGAAVGLWALGTIISRRNEVMEAEHKERREEKADD